MRLSALPRRPALPYRQRRQQRLPIRAPQPCARVPAFSGRVGPIIPRRYIAKSILRTRCIKRRIHKACMRAALLIDQRNQRGPRRGHRASPPKDRALPVHTDLIPRRRVGISRNIRHSPPRKMRRVHRCRNLCRSLVGRHRKLLTHPPAAGTFAHSMIPNHFLSDLRPGRFQPRASTRQCVGAR